MGTTTYRLGNQSEEFELSEEFLGLIPTGFDNWLQLIFEINGTFPYEVTLNQEGAGNTIIIVIHQPIIKEAFPLSLFTEERTENWCNFAIVSKKGEPTKKFVIPLH